MLNLSDTNLSEIQTRKRHHLLLGGTAIVGSLMLASQAIAQDPEAAAEEEETKVEEIMVTGSRIKRDNFSSSSPMDIVRAEDATRMGFPDLASMLRASTVAAGSSQVTSAISTATVQNGGPGTDTISLRGLGANRTLSLLNGRRAGPAGTRGSVSSFDMNVLPLAGIQSVEILKDGASSIYGSDAVAGVVNYITKKGDGGEINANISQPTSSGGESYQISGSYGQEFDRGYFRVTADYYREEELAKGDREYFQCGENYYFDQTTGERGDLIDPRTGEYKCEDSGWGHVWTYDYSADYTAGGGDGTTNFPPSGRLLQYDYEGHLAQYLPSINELADPTNPYHGRTPEGWYPTGYDDISDALYQYDHPFQNEESLIPKKELFTIMAEGEFEISDNITAYAEVLFNRRTTYENYYRQYWSYIYNENYLPWENDEVIPGSGNPVNTGWTGAQWYSPTPVTDHNDSSTKIDYTRFVGGFKGELGGSGWDYDASFQYSKSDAEYGNDVIYNDSVRSNNWLWGSCEGTVTSVRGVPCVDVDWLNPENMRGNVTDEEREFLFGHEVGTTIYKNYSIDLSFANSNVFEMPAGGVGVAIGGQYMYDSINDQPGEVSQAGNAWSGGLSLPTVGDHNSKSAFAEAIIPLLADIPMIQRLDFTGSVRYTDVSSYGSGTTYKLGLDWQVAEAIRFRAGYGTSFRSPALFELFVQAESSSRWQRDIDPCYLWGDGLNDGNITQRQADNCASQGIPDDSNPSISADILAQGGFGVLDAETSTSKTLGVIWTPDFADLRLSVDYFNIEVRGEIDQFGAENILWECYDSENFPNDPLCDLFDRLSPSDPLGAQVTTVRDSYINIASQRNAGWDIEAVYNTTLPHDIQLNVHTQHTITTTDETEIFEGFPESFENRMGRPRWVGNLTFSFLKGPWSATWRMRGVGSTSNVEANDGITTTTRNGTTYDIVLTTPRVVYHNVSVGRELGNGFDVILGVSNAFGKAPPQVSQSPNTRTRGRAALYSQYDWRGRRFFLNLKKSF